MQRREPATSKNETLRFLIVEYANGAAFTTFGNRSDMLSKPLIALAKKVGDDGDDMYDGFYACTHRSYQLQFILNKKISKQLTGTQYTEEDIAKNFSTYKITKHFSKAANLPCEAVSTPEDLINDRECGDGYERVIMPFERQRIDAVSPEDYIPLDELNKLTISSKNMQLLQIAQHAVKFNPRAENIKLDYVGVKRDMCDKALAATIQSGWPQNVTLKVILQQPENKEEPFVWIMGPKPDGRKRKAAVMAEGVPEVPQAEAMKVHGMFGRAAKRQATEKAMVERRQTRSMTEAAEAATFRGIVSGRI